MSNQQVKRLVIVVIGLLVIVPLVHAQETRQSEREAMYYRYLEFPSYVKGGSVEPHWMADGSSFWYAEGAPANTVIWKIDPKANTKQPLFDTERLRQALTPLLGHKLPYQGLPFAEFTFVDGEKAVQFAVEDKEYVLQLNTYTITQAPAFSEEEKSRLVPQAGEVLSPDRRWFAAVKEHNLWLRSTYDGRSVQITTDGIEDYAWNMEGAQWSPDSFKLAVQKADYRKVPKIPVVHWLKPTVEVEWVPFPIAGGANPQTELFIVDVLSKRQVRVDVGEESGQDIYILSWRPDGSELLFFRRSRDHKKLDLMAANSKTGSTRVILTETQKTFVRFPFWGWTTPFTLLEDGMRFIWMSERDGWNHLYFYDLGGNLVRRLTEGSFPVLRVVAVDEKAGWVYFIAHGDRQRPYDTHLYRVNLEGKEFTRLTEATGQHDAPRIAPWLLARASPIQFAPSKQFFLDTHSSVDRPPAVELRRADGTLLQTLSKANIDALKELQWSPPEEFVVKAADGKTDLYGILYKPYDFDPNKKYPVIESIYARPEWTVVPQTFTSNRWGIPAQALAQLGFITFIVEGRGTSERGKEFQDVVYGNIGRYEIPDHVVALKQLGEERPYMDLSRVGIKGKSSGGYMAVRALLLAPEVYHVGVASAQHPQAGVAWYIGLPQNNKEAYDYASNLRFADNLKGKLLLIHGTSDRVVPFSATMKMVEALIRANKPYDLIVLPGFRHLYNGNSKTYWLEAIRRYFQEHLTPEKVVP